MDFSAAAFFCCGVSSLSSVLKKLNSRFLASAALGITVERLTGWTFKRSLLIGAVSFGVATGITIGVLRLIFQVKLLYILLPG